MIQLTIMLLVMIAQIWGIVWLWQAPVTPRNMKLTLLYIVLCILWGAFLVVKLTGG